MNISALTSLSDILMVTYLIVYACIHSIYTAGLICARQIEQKKHTCPQKAYHTT